MQPVPGATPLRVAYVVSRYPTLSHAFIEREVLSLRDLGVEVDTFSVRPYPQDELRSAVMRDEAARTTVLLDRIPGLAKRHLALLRRSPRAYGAGLARAAGAGSHGVGSGAAGSGGTGGLPGRAAVKARLWPFFYFAEAVALYEEMRDRGIRHAHAHFANVASDVARFAVALGRAEDGPDSAWRWSFTLHGFNEFETDLPNKIRSACAVSCISEYARSELAAVVEAGEHDKLRIVHMAVDADRYVPPTPDRQVRAAGPVRILFVGRLSAEKGAPALVRAVAELVATGVDVELRIVGAGAQREEIVAEVTAHGLGDVVDMAGPKSQEELPEQYQWADIFALPSTLEGLPVVLMEAMASGLPVVSTRITGIPELVNEGNGRLVTPANHAELVAALGELAADPALRAALGRAGRESVLTGFTPATTGPRMRDLLAACAP